MTYEEAKKKLEEYWEKFHPEGEYADAISKGMQAIDDCIEMGLTGEGE